MQVSTLSTRVGINPPPRTQRRDDDGKRRGNRGIAVTTGSTTQYAVRAGQHVNVELGVNFQRAQYHHVETINRCTFEPQLAYWLALISM